MSDSRLRRLVLIGLIAGAPAIASAQVPTSEEPGHQAARFSQPTAVKARPAVSISLPSSVAPPGASAVILHLERINIVGGTVYPTSALEPLYAQLIGKDVSLAAIYNVVEKITAKYGGDGYVLSRAIVPPQRLDPKDAAVTIQIVEGYVDQVVWPASLDDYGEFTRQYTAEITVERPANINTIMRYLLLADDWPGVRVSSTFKASPINRDASSLVIDATQKAVQSSAEMDNRGTEARGPWEFILGSTFNDLLHAHEQASLSYGGATDLSELQYLDLNYQQTLDAEGLKAFADVTYSWGRPGTATLRTLDYASQSLSADLGLAYPVIRSRDKNLTLSGLVFLSDNKGELLSAPNSEDRLRGVRVKANAEAIDGLAGTDQASATVSHGFQGFDSTLDGNSLASRVNGRVDFTTIAGSVSRLQPLGRGFSAVVAAEGQYAFTPLLSPEECSFGGKEFGRAFDPAEDTGDDCWSVSGELRFDPDLPTNPLDKTELYGFADYGHIFRIAPAAGTTATFDGASAGAGVRVGKGTVSADLSAAKPLLGRADEGWRYFLTMSASY